MVDGPGQCAAAQAILQPVVDVLSRAFVDMERAIRPLATAFAAAADSMMQVCVQYAEQIGRQVAPAMKAIAEAEAARSRNGT